MRTWREFTWLVRVKALSGLARGAHGAGRAGRIALVLGVGGLTLPGIYLLLLRFLRSLQSTAEVGPLLAAKLLGLGLMLLLSILLLSNLIAALSSFFLARDLPTILAAPVDWLAVYGARLVETGVSSSWMVALVLVPVLAAYGRVYGAGPAYVGYAVLVIVPLLVIPAAAGSAVTLLLVRVFPARRTRDLLGVIAAAGVALLVLGLRMLRPERLVNPEGFRNLMDFLAILRGPSSPWLPSQWTADALMGFLRGRADPFLPVLLWGTAGGVTALGAVLHQQHYSTCYTRAQEGATRRVRWGRLWNGLGRLLAPLGPQRRELVLKDARVFFRDATQWSQLIILGVLVVVYVYNMRVLPLRSSESVGRYLSSLVTFLNVALTGFVLAAIAARFVFPALSLEGRTLWLLRSSPLPASSLLWSKFWSGMVPLLVLALALTLLTTAGLGVGPEVTLLSVVTVTGLTTTFTAQALAWGIAYPKFESENAAQIPTSIGGLLFMLGALLTLGIVVAFQLWAMRGWVRSGLPWRQARPPSAEEMGVAIGFTVALCAVSGALAYRDARRRLERLEA
ncbi:MAG: hypothetical protein Q8W51_08170 [Candidatus Palauibacterales bacterium]|nr:hypothetical protein [Candidatus Palauibacterales bacterium]MDP2529699.1 hypothetical protein [Candidatus Palauibacterales bacterium]MDP2584115.1 hypothetical protein [Candidatus Palauibacterales bacterium]